MEDDPLIGLLLLQLFFILLNAVFARIKRTSLRRRATNAPRDSAALLPSPRAFWLLYRYQSHLPAS